MYILAEWVLVDKVDQITEDHLKACVESGAHINPEDYNLFISRKEFRT